MKTRVIDLGQAVLSLFFCLSLAGCNKDDYYQKQYLGDSNWSTPTDGTVPSGEQGGASSGMEDGTQGGVSSGEGDGGTNGGTTSDLSTSGSSGGGSVDGSTTGGQTGSTTTGGTTSGTSDSSTSGSNDTIYTEVVENFKQSQDQAKKIDILWIVDNSGSMGDEQDSLGRNFDAFIHEFINRKVDFKMAITTTDTSSAAKKGAIVTGSDTKLTSAMAQSNPTQFMSDFKKMVRVGTSGSGYEKGLEASEGFMQKYSTTFVRADAYLAVVVLSDEEDQSPKTPAQYTDYLKSFKKDSGLVKFYSIVDVGLSNKNGGNGITAGYQRYASASENTAGIIGDIAEDFYKVLSQMGDSIINLLDSFALAQDPIPGSLKVYVNNELVNNYAFDSSSRSIKFNPGSLPPVGSEIKVVYLK